MQQISNWQKLPFCLKCCSFACLSPACDKSREWGRWLLSLSHCSLPVFSVILGSPRDTVCEDIPSNKLVLNCPIKRWEQTWARVGFSWCRAVRYSKCALPDFCACGWLHCRGWTLLHHNLLEVLTMSGSFPTVCWMLRWKSSFWGCSMHEEIYMLYGFWAYCYLKDILLAANVNAW